MLNYAPPALNIVRFIDYGRWWYDHSSTRLPVWTLLDGTRDYPDRQVGRGVPVLIRPASRFEQEQMFAWFERVTHDLAAEGFVTGLGNFDPTEKTSAEVEAAKRTLLAAARAYVDGLDYSATSDARVLEFLDGH